MGAIKFHSRVRTPFGEGIVQGQRLVKQEDGSFLATQIIVSHKPELNIDPDHQMCVCATPGIWTLAMYDPCDLVVLER